MRSLGVPPAETGSVADAAEKERPPKSIGPLPGVRVGAVAERCSTVMQVLPVSAWCAIFKEGYDGDGIGLTV